MTNSLVAVAVWLSLAATVAPQGRAGVAREAGEELARRADELIATIGRRLPFTRVPRAEMLKKLETEVARSVVLYDASGSKRSQSSAETEALTALVARLRSGAESLLELKDYADLGISDVSWKQCRATLTAGVMRIPLYEKTFNICTVRNDARAIPTMMEKLGY
jgi:hypothetical protein